MTSYVVNSGQTSSGLTLGSGDTLTVNTGGTATGTTLNSDGRDYVSGGTANGTTVNDGGYQTVYSGGTAGGTTVNGGYEIVSGGTAGGTTVNGGYEIVSGGTASGTTVNSGFEIVSDGTANGTTVNGGCEFVSGGTANGTTVNSGGQEVVDSGTANGITVNSGGQEIVYSGTANGITVNSGGQEIVYGGTASGTVLQGGTASVSGGTLEISSASSGTVGFLGTGTLVVDSLAAFNPTSFAGFAPGDIINLKDVSPSASTVRLSETALSITSGSSTKTLTLSSAPDAIGEVADPTGGIDLFEVPVSPANTLAFTQAGETILVDPATLGSSGVHAIDGGNLGNDALVANGTAVDFSGLTFNNWTTSETVSITGGPGDSTLSGALQPTTITGAAGDDQFTVHGTNGADAVNGGGGTNTIHTSALAGTGAVTVDLRHRVEGRSDGRQHHEHPGRRARIRHLDGLRTFLGHRYFLRRHGRRYLLRGRGDRYRSGRHRLRHADSGQR